MDSKPGEHPAVSEVVRHVVDDLKTIASSEVELGRNLLVEHFGRLLAKASITIFGAMVALIGFAMLCTAAVVALEPVIPGLALRLLIMAGVYIMVGVGVAVYYARKIGKQPGADLHQPIAELEDTANSIQRGLSH